MSDSPIGHEPQWGPDDFDYEDEFIDAFDVLDGEELAEQLRTGVTRIRRTR